MKKFCEKLVANPLLEYLIIALILFSALILGLETDKTINQHYSEWLIRANQLILGIFILEACIKIIAAAPRFQDYFTNGWNLFDFTIIILSLIPFSAEYAMVARLLRLLRILRLVSRVRQLRLIIVTLLRSIPSMGHVMLLMMMLMYIYAITGYHLFHQAIPEHWGSLGQSLLTLSTIATLEGWPDHMAKCVQVTPYAWIYFISFIIFATFIIINLFIAIVLDNMEKAKQETLTEIKDDQAELLREFLLIENQLASLRMRLLKNPETTNPSPKNSDD
jgi:voltage-gated sodium channel